MLHQPWPPMKTHGLPVFESLVALARKILNRPWLGVLATAKWYLLMALLGNYVPKSCNLTPLHATFLQDLFINLTGLESHLSHCFNGNYRILKMTLGF